ncbi:MAG: VanZ family protein [Bacteroidales bacterium]|nr:VanZ family protein [Bacteroidales bacterium]
MKALTRILKILVFAAYLAGVAYLCFNDSPDTSKLPKELFGLPIDKCVHFAMFLPFPILGTLAFDFRSWWRPLCVTTLMANVIAFSFELLQSKLTDTRVTDPADLNANILGISLGLLFMVIVGLLRRKDA